MKFEFITVETTGHVTTVTINRPKSMNALHPYAVGEMQTAFDAFQHDPDQWVAIVTGAGDKAFCAGNDLKFQAEHGALKVRELRQNHVSGFGGLSLRESCHKPIIAAVNGLALGGGFEIVLSCDIIIAADHAQFGLPEPRVGLMAGYGGVHRLPRQIPYHVAMGVILAGKRLSAQQGEAYGLVNEVVPADQLMSCALQWADAIQAGAPLSVQASKEAVNRGLGVSLEQAMQVIYPIARRMYDSEDLIEGPRAFAEKRAPQWKGK
ncbi:MAG: enoyl-CoA hydratase-related protein [Burkholderiaceae bacterium]